MAKVIFHIDLNAFFATAETVNNPALKGKPVGVGGHGRKGILSTANYEARKYGVHSAMPVFEALQKCPDLIVVPGNYELYSRLSNEFMNLIRSYTSLIEQASVDECYADMSDVIKKYDKPLDLAIEIQKRLLDNTGLTCSIGIAPNKFLAKMASDFKKPNGITILRIREVESKLWPLDITEMGGIGKKTAPQLKKYGILKIGDLVLPENRYYIDKILGKNAETYVNYALGKDDSEIINYYEMKSMSQSTTFSEDLINYDDIQKNFMKLAKELSDRLIENKSCGNNISITIRYYNFETINRCVHLDHFTNTFYEILDNAMQLYEANDKDLPIRLIGVGINNLKDLNHLTNFDLFNYKEESNKRDINKIIALLNQEIPNANFKKLSELEKKSEFSGIFRK